MSTYEFDIDSTDTCVAVYEDGVYIGDFYPRGSGGGISFRGLFMTLAPITLEAIFALMCVICPIFFFSFILPGHGFVDAILEGAHLVALWIVSVIVTALMIKRRIFIHNIYHSDDEKYVAIRRALNENITDESETKVTKDGKGIDEEETKVTEDDKGIDEEETKYYIKEISSPLERALSQFRIILICLTAVLMIGKLIFPTLPFAEGMMAIIMPIFAYGYILSFVSGYISYGKVANFFLLSFLVATFIASSLMGMEPLKPIAEYMVIIALLACHEVTSRIIKWKLG